MLVAAADHGGVRVLTLRRPPVNALDLEMAVDIARQVEAARDAGSPGLVLTGAPGVFSAGIDTRRIPAYSTAERQTMLRTVNRTILALYAYPAPVVAAVSGHALGGGLVLALTADLRIAARGDFRIGLTEARAGIPFPAGPLEVVQAELPQPERRVLMLEARSFAPDHPLLASVFDRIAEPEALLREAQEACNAMVELPGHAAVKRQLRADTVRRLQHIVDHDVEPMLEGWL